MEITKTIIERASDNCKVIINGELQEEYQYNNGLDNTIEYLKNSHGSDNSSMVSLLTQLKEIK